MLFNHIAVHIVHTRYISVNTGMVGNLILYKIYLINERTIVYCVKDVCVINYQNLYILLKYTFLYMLYRFSCKLDIKSQLTHGYLN